MATFACVSLPPQFITPPPSTSNCIQHNDSDCGSSTGTSGASSMSPHDTSSENGSTTSAQATPPEFPSPPPPSNSPPESMASLQAESPTEDENHSLDSGGGGSPPLAEEVEETDRPPAEILLPPGLARGRTFIVGGKRIKEWVAQHGYHEVPENEKAAGILKSSFFVHVNDDQTFQFRWGADKDKIGSLQGPGTIRMVGDAGRLNQPFLFRPPPGQRCHQFVDEEGTLRHVVLSVASTDSGTQKPRELNIPEIVGGQHLMNALGINLNNDSTPNPPADPNQPGPAGPPVGPAAGLAPQNHRRGASRGGGHHFNTRGGHNGGGGRGNGRNGHGQRHDDHQVRPQNGRGGYRGSRQYNGHGRGYHHQGLNREQHQNNQPVVVAEEMTQNGNDNNNEGIIAQNMAGAPNVAGSPGAAVPLMQPQVMAMGGQVSLLGEPTGPPMGHPIPPMIGYQPILPQQGVPLMLGPPPDIAQQDNQLAVVPAGQMPPAMQPGLLQDPMGQGAPMGMAPFGMQPPPGLMVPFNNNKWFEPNPIEENEFLKTLIQKLEKPSESKRSITWFEFFWTPINPEVFLGSPFHYLADTEILYEATVVEESTGSSTTHIMDPRLSVMQDNIPMSIFRLTMLRPLTAYKLNLKASIVDRGLEGDVSDDFKFMTYSGRPDTPCGVTVVTRTENMLALTWQEPFHNGATISFYDVHLTTDNIEGRIIKTSTTKVNIPNLEPGTCYKIAITAFNAIGESYVPARIEGFTKSDKPPSMPENVEVIGISHRSIRVTWKADPNCSFLIEVCDSWRRNKRIVRDNFIGTVTIIGELIHNSLYYVRVSSRNDHGQTSTAWIGARTQIYQPFRNQALENNRGAEKEEVPRLIQTHYERLPSSPHFIQFADHVPEMGWSTYHVGSREHVFVGEGATFEQPDVWTEFYRGPEHSILVYDENIHYMRIYVSYTKGKGQRSQPTVPVVVPREYVKYRPDSTKSLTLTKLEDGSVLALWDTVFIDQNRFPATAKLWHQIQRSDLDESPIYNVKGTDLYGQCKLLFGKIPEGTSITLRARGVLLYRDVLVPGDWTPPVTYREPRKPPPPVSAILYNIDTSLLSWECADSAPDLQFKVEVVDLTDGLSLQKVNTKEKNLVLDGLSLGQKYKATITSFTKAGESEESTQKFRLPAQKPGVPKNVHITNIESANCFLSFTQAEENGSSIVGYVVELKKKQEADKIFRSRFVEPQDDNYRVKLKELPANQEFDMSIVARNSIGKSESVEMSFKTKPICPVAPTMEADSEPNALKIRWEQVTTSPSIHYKVFRKNSRDNWQMVYDGVNHSVRVKALEENTDYDFELRVFDRESGETATSEIQTFRTSTTPPPPVKKSVTCSLVPGETHLYRVTWEKALPDNSPLNQFYRLQTVDATVQGAKFETIYEGTTPSYELNTEVFPEGLHVRVLCIRIHENKEIKGGSSPSYFLANIPPKVEEPEIEEPRSRMTELFNHAVNSNAFVAFALVLMFFLCCLTIYFSEPFFQWLLTPTEGPIPEDASLSVTPSQTSITPPTPTRPPGQYR